MGSLLYSSPIIMLVRQLSSRDQFVGRILQPKHELQRRLRRIPGHPPLSVVQILPLTSGFGWWRVSYPMHLQEERVKFHVALFRRRETRNRSPISSGTVTMAGGVEPLIGV